MNIKKLFSCFNHPNTLLVISSYPDPKTGIVLAVPYKKASWMATGDPLNWLKANITLALRHPDYQKDLKAFLKTLN